MVRTGRSILIAGGMMMVFIATLFPSGSLVVSHAVKGIDTKLVTDERLTFKLRAPDSLGARKEGILRQKPVHRGVKLLSATIDYRGETPLEGTPSCSVGFFLEDTSKVRITVHQPRSLYQMTPDTTLFPEGFSSFGWTRRTVLSRLNIDPADLYAVAEIQNSRPLKIAPAVLYDRDSPADTIKGYRFIFGTDTRSSFEFQILRLGPSGSERVYAGALMDQRPGEVLITWDGRDENRQLVADGLCRLKIKITCHSRYKKERALIFIREFYHKAVIR